MKKISLFIRLIVHLFSRCLHHFLTRLPWIFLHLHLFLFLFLFLHLFLSDHLNFICLYYELSELFFMQLPSQFISKTLHKHFVRLLYLLSFNQACRQLYHQLYLQQLYLKFSFQLCHHLYLQLFTNFL